MCVSAEMMKGTVGGEGTELSRNLDLSYGLLTGENDSGLMALTSDC